MRVKDVLAEYDAAIDELAEDAKGYHEAVTAMHRDVQIERGLSPQQVSQMARRVDREADAEEGVPYGEDDEYNLSDLDELDAAEENGRGHRRRRRKTVKITVIVPPSPTGIYIEAICPRGTIADQRHVPPSERARKVALQVPAGRNTIRMLKPVGARPINAKSSGVVDMRRRRGRRR